MHTLYAKPNTYAFGVHMMLEEMATPYQVVNPSDDPGTTDSDFLHASPHRRVPAIVLPSGTAICESGAIALHLADSCADRKYTVAESDGDRASYLQQFFYLSSTLQPEVLLQFHPENYFAEESLQQQLMKSSLIRLNTVLQVLDERYKNGPWLFGEHPTAADYTLLNVLRWPECLPEHSTDYPNLRAMYDAMTQRDSYNAILPWHLRQTTVTGNVRNG